MAANISLQAQQILTQRFGGDSLMALATIAEDGPAVRAVNAHYEDGAFYIITDARSQKMQHIRENAAVALCGDWFTAKGVAEDLGYLLDERNAALAQRLKTAFAAWYGNGHINEQDENTHILCVRLKNGVLFSQGTRYDLVF